MQYVCFTEKKEESLKKKRNLAFLFLFLSLALIALVLFLFFFFLTRENRILFLFVFCPLLCLCLIPPFLLVFLFLLPIQRRLKLHSRFQSKAPSLPFKATYLGAKEETSTIEGIPCIALCFDAGGRKELLYVEEGEEVPLKEGEEYSLVRFDSFLSEASSR